VWVCLVARAVLVCATGVLAGCSLSQPAEFRLNTEGRDPSEIKLAQRDEIVDTLARLFGTPDEPKIPRGVDLQPELLQAAAGPMGRDAEGKRRGLYRQYCAACHGISGDGAGPIAALLNPYPRDLRNGGFKYTSTTYGAKPVWKDLDRALRRGNSDTAMPSFDLLPRGEIDALIEYVEYLSIRGETELLLLQEVVDLDNYPLDDGEVVDQVAFLCCLWAEAEAAAVKPPERPPTSTGQQLATSIAAGGRLFLSESAKCFQCHGTEGRGDGEQSELYDDWNTEKTKKDPAWLQLRLQRLWPRDFTRETFRGGDRPVDVYWRVHTGINGTPMPPAGPRPGSAGSLTPEEIWHVVSFVRSLGRHKTATGGHKAATGGHKAATGGHKAATGGHKAATGGRAKGL
jgi:mono/diheme cytochrome c family protein